MTTPPEKAVDDAPRLLYPIPGAAEARVVPVDPAADELPPPPLTVYPLVHNGLVFSFLAP